MGYDVDYYSQRVLDEITAWPVGILADYTRLVELLIEFGPDVRMPHSRTMGGGLLELRPRGREGIGRALYCFVLGNRVVVLHAFIKTTKATPNRDLEVARRRMKEVRGGQR
jgi:phage-related protein